MSSNLTWDPKFSVGNYFIDTQHKVIISLIEAIEEQNEKQVSDLEVVKETLRKLLDYTASHFADEELLLEQHSYPDLAEHKKIHSKLIKQTEMLQKKFDEVGSEVVPILAEFLRTWLYSHIEGVDMKYKSYVGMFSKPQKITSPEFDATDLLEPNNVTKKNVDISTPSNNESLEDSIKKKFTSHESLDRILYLDQETKMVEAVKAIKEKKPECVLLLNSKEDIVGIVTEKDIVLRFLAVENFNINEHSIGAISSRKIESIDTSSFKDDLRKVLGEKKIRHFPITNGTPLSRKSIVGFLEMRDIAIIASTGYLKVY